MGCDIHVHAEVKIGGAWHHYATLDIARDYDLFSKMAGVRGSLPPIVEPRGVPDDLSIITRLDWERGRSDWHNPSWLTTAEVGEIQGWHQQQHPGNWQIVREWGYLFGNNWGGFGKYPKDYPPEIEDARLVFWFDN